MCAGGICCCSQLLVESTRPWPRAGADSQMCAATHKRHCSNCTALILGWQRCGYSWAHRAAGAEQAPGALVPYWEANTLIPNCSTAELRNTQLFVSRTVPKLRVAPAQESTALLAAKNRQLGWAWAVGGWAQLPAWLGVAGALKSFPLPCD